jgi:hypothetical protein
VNADTPCNRHRRRGPLPRSTDYARLLLHRAQLALAALAVPVAVAVGIAAIGPEPDAGATAGAGAQQVSDLESGIESPTAPGALARAEEIADELDPAGSDAVAGDGLLAGLGTLAGCWVLLVAAGAVWRRRLVERDLQGWSDGWARVEPLWSDRPR